jgi:hypothetical protein
MWLIDLFHVSTLVGRWHRLPDHGRLLCFPTVGLSIPPHEGDDAVGVGVLSLSSCKRADIWLLEKLKEGFIILLLLSALRLLSSAAGDSCRRTCFLAEVEAPVAFVSADGEHTYKYEMLESIGNKKVYHLNLDGSSFISSRFMQKFLTMSVSGTDENFEDAQRLLGKHEDGSMWDRDGVAFSRSFVEYAMEWQVDHMRGDPRLFADADRAPQLPYELCRMPTAARPNSRHLRANTALLQKAQSACSDAVTSAGDLELCIDDVMVTGELGLASVW